MKSKLDLENRLLTFRVDGDLLSTTVAAVRGDIDACLDISLGDSQWDTFRLDLTAARMVNAAGLNLVVWLFKHVQERGSSMQVAYSSTNVLRTFAAVHADKYVEMVEV